MRDVYRYTRLIGKILQTLFPQAVSSAITAPSISRDHKIGRFGVGLLAHVAPPVSNTVYGKFCRVRINTQAGQSAPFVFGLFKPRPLGRGG